MQMTLGWIVLILGGALYLAQVISAVNFPLAQRLGIQEAPGSTDTVVQRAEQYTAYWDLVAIGWLPLAGLLLVIDHDWWPIVALVGGAVYLDTAGREAIKHLVFRHEGYRVGTESQQRLFFASFFVMAAIAIPLIAYAIASIA